jgi:hypothetical protein
MGCCDLQHRIVSCYSLVDIYRLCLEVPVASICTVYGWGQNIQFVLKRQYIYTGLYGFVSQKNDLKFYHLSDYYQQFLYKHLLFSTSIVCSEFGTDVDNSINFPLKWNGRHVASENTNDNSLCRDSFAAHQCGTIYFLSHVKLCVSKHKLLNCELPSIKF